MTDLYDDAAALPRILHGARNRARYPDACDLMLTPSRLRRAVARGHVLHPFRDAYIFGSGQPDLLDLIRAALMVLPQDAVVAYHTAAALYGFGVAATQAVHVAVPAGAAVPQRRGVVAHETVLPVDAVVEIFGVPCLPPARCALDLSRTLRRPDALAVLDAALRCGACTVEELTVSFAATLAFEGYAGRASLCRWQPRSRSADRRANCGS
jgi:hypothetical protein